MAMDYSKFAGLPSGYVVSGANTPLDGRLIVNDVTEISEIPMPYIGLMVYVTNEEKYYVVKSLKDGYMEMASSNVVPTQPAGDEWVDWMLLQNALVDTYEEFTTGGAGLTEDQQKAMDALGMPSEPVVPEVLEHYEVCDPGADGALTVRDDANIFNPSTEIKLADANQFGGSFVENDKVKLVPEHYEISAEPDALEVVANDIADDAFDPATQIKLNDANAKKPSGAVDFNVGDKVKLVGDAYVSDPDGLKVVADAKPDLQPGEVLKSVADVNADVPFNDGDAVVKVEGVPEVPAKDATGLFGEVDDIEKKLKDIEDKLAAVPATMELTKEVAVLHKLGDKIAADTKVLTVKVNDFKVAPEEVTVTGCNVVDNGDGTWAATLIDEMAATTKLDVNVKVDGDVLTDELTIKFVAPMFVGPIIKAEAIPEHYEIFSGIGQAITLVFDSVYEVSADLDALTVVADDADPFDPATEIKLADANQFGGSFVGGEKVKLVDNVPGVDELKVGDANGVNVAANAGGDKYKTDFVVGNQVVKIDAYDPNNAVTSKMEEMVVDVDELKGIVEQSVNITVPSVMCIKYVDTLPDLVNITDWQGNNLSLMNAFVRTTESIEVDSTMYDFKVYTMKMPVVITDTFYFHFK